MTFIKLQEVISPYTWIFFGALFVCLVGFGNAIAKAPWPKLFAASFVGGYLISFFALNVAEVITGRDRLANSISAVGILPFIGTQLVLTGICAGWLLGLLGAAGTKVFLKFKSR